MSRAGEFDRRVTIREATEARDTEGHVVFTWPGTLVDTVWAARLDVPAREGVIADQLLATRTVGYRMRYRTDLKAKQRIYEGTEVFEIQSWGENPQAARRSETVVDCVRVGV